MADLQPDQFKKAKPDWVASQQRARGICESCGSKPSETEYAGTGQNICFDCLAKKRAKGLG